LENFVSKENELEKKLAKKAQENSLSKLKEKIEKVYKKKEVTEKEQR